MTRMQNRMGRFTRSFARGLRTLDRGVAKFTRGLRRTGIALGAMVLTVGAAQANVLTLGATFERTLVDTGLRFEQAIFRGDKGFEQLRKQARDLGRSTVVTANEVAQAQNLLVKSGFNLQEVLALTEPTIAIAVVSQLSLAEATTIATESLNIMGLRTGDAANVRKNFIEVSDQMTFASNRANITFRNLFDSLKKAGPVAVAASQSLGDLLTILTVLGRKGIKEGEAGTATRNIIASILNVTPEAEKILGAFQLTSIDKQTGKVRSMIDIFEDLNRVTEQLIETGRLTKGEQVIAFFKVFGRRPFAAAAGLTRSAAGEIQILQKSMLTATGIVKLMSDELLNTTFGAMKEFQAAIEGVQLTIFATEKGPMTDFIRRMTEMVRAFERDGGARKIGEFAVKLIDNFDVIVAKLKLIGIGLVVIGVLVIALKALILVMTLVNLVIVTNPFVVITLAILAFIAAIVSVIFFLNQFRTLALSLPDPIKAILVLFVPPSELEVTWKGIGIFFKGLWAGIADSFESGADRAIEAIGRIVNAFGIFFPTLQDIKDFFNLAIKINAAKFNFLLSEGASGSQVVSSENRVAKTLSEHRTSTSAEVTIRSEAGQLVLTGGTLGPNIILDHSGAF